MLAPHLRGGNSFDDVRVDLPAAFAVQDDWLRMVEKRSVRRSRIRNMAALAAFAAEWRFRLREPLVASGVRRRWFDEFNGYWTEVIGGRPLTITDFHGLRFEYRRRAQISHELDWGSAEQHLSNWADPANLAATFLYVYREALQPLRSRALRRLLGRGGRVLEYGCSLAPMYRTWRAFHSHVPCSWVLADIPTFPFHFARHAYARDAEASFVTISVDQLDDPLSGAADGFDLILVQEVFEHLHAPRRMAEYLLDRLNSGGLFAFDYIAKSSALGHDTPAGVDERIETLEYLAGQLDVVHGRLRVGPETVSLCAGRRRGG
jgi:SAM-dependent methyltransferase